MQEERPVAGHAPSVVHNSRDVARQRDTLSMINAKAPNLNGKECFLSGEKMPAYSPLASSSQISKKTMRSYLA